MRSHLFIPWLATVTSAVDTCGYLVTDPLAANLLHAQSACSSFMQTTNSLCPTTTTLTQDVAITAATTTTTTQTVVLTGLVTKNSTTTLTASFIPVATLTTKTSTTNVPNPTGPILGSADRNNKRAADAIPCPQLVSPEVPGPFAFFCQPSAFSSACRRVKILPTTQTKQNTVTVTVNSTSTIRPTSIRTVSVSTTTTATLNNTLTTTTTTTVATPTSTVTVVETDVAGVGRFYLNARGAAYNGPVSGTNTVKAGDPLTLSNTNRFYYYYSIGTHQNLQTSFNPFQVLVSGGINGGVDFTVRFSGYNDGRDPSVLKCELSQATSGNLTCISGTTQKTTLFQACNGDGKLYHGPGLLAGCSALQLYTVSA